MIYLDANVIIRLVEGTEAVSRPVTTRLRASVARAVPPFVTSRLTQLECRCKPMRDGNTNLLAVYDGLFSSRDLRPLDIDAAVIEQATRLRAKYRFKSPDALHLASAVVAGASVFLTGDQQLRQCTEVNVEIV